MSTEIQERPAPLWTPAGCRLLVGGGVAEGGSRQPDRGGWHTLERWSKREWTLM